MTDMKVQPGIMDIAPYVGGESDIDGAKEIIKLSSNEGALGPSPEASETYAALQRELHRYPEGECTATTFTCSRIRSPSTTSARCWPPSTRCVKVTDSALESIAFKRQLL